jgi:hypothetical protein
LLCERATEGEGDEKVGPWNLGGLIVVCVANEQFFSYGFLVHLIPWFLGRFQRLAKCEV